jgi:hypothetical protein
VPTAACLIIARCVRPLFDPKDFPNLCPADLLHNAQRIICWPNIYIYSLGTKSPVAQDKLLTASRASFGSNQNGRNWFPLHLIYTIAKHIKTWENILLTACYFQSLNSQYTKTTWSPNDKLTSEFGIWLHWALGQSYELNLYF